MNNIPKTLEQKAESFVESLSSFEVTILLTDCFKNRSLHETAKSKESKQALLLWFILENMRTFRKLKPEEILNRYKEKLKDLKLLEKHFNWLNFSYREENWFAVAIKSNPSQGFEINPYRLYTGNYIDRIILKNECGFNDVAEVLAKHERLWNLLQTPKSDINWITKKEEQLDWAYRYLKNNQTKVFKMKFVKNKIRISVRLPKNKKLPQQYQVFSDFNQNDKTQLYQAIISTLDLMAIREFQRYCHMEFDDLLKIKQIKCDYRDAFIRRMKATWNEHQNAKKKNTTKGTAVLINAKNHERLKLLCEKNLVKEKAFVNQLIEKEYNKTFPYTKSKKKTKSKTNKETQY